MGLDNGIYVRSNKRKLTKDMLPATLSYPFPEIEDWTEDLEIAYFRKYWGMRNEIVGSFQHHDEYNTILFETPEQVRKLISIIASWLNETKWNEEGDSIWEYESAARNLINVIVNLSTIYAFMQNNPDVYLEFYDSY